MTRRGTNRTDQQIVYLCQLFPATTALMCWLKLSPHQTLKPRHLQHFRPPTDYLHYRALQTSILRLKDFSIIWKTVNCGAKNAKRTLRHFPATIAAKEGSFMTALSEHYMYLIFMCDNFDICILTNKIFLYI